MDSDNEHEDVIIEQLQQDMDDFREIFGKPLFALLTNRILWWNLFWIVVLVVLLTLHR